MPPTLMLTLISAAVSLAIGFAGGWTANGWRLGAEIAQIKESQSVAVAQGVKETLNTYTKYIQRKDDAVKNAEKRAALAAADSAAVRAESDGLRSQLSDATARIATATDTALREYATTVNAVFEASAERYTDMAGKAQGHATDVQTLIEAWPKAEEKK